MIVTTGMRVRFAAGLGRQRVEAGEVVNLEVDGRQVDSLDTDLAPDGYLDIRLGNRETWCQGRDVFCEVVAPESVE